MADTTRTTRATQTEQDPRWRQVLARDIAADGTFVYSVRTTGVYCRPSCASRPAKPENVRFHDSCAAAEAAGFRACKRCAPNAASLQQQHAAAMTAACRTIEQAEHEPTLEQLAARAGMSPFHFHRLFRAIVGVTPKAYARAHRGARVRSELTKSGTVSRAIYEAGYNSSGRFYADSYRMLGMTPSGWREGGAGEAIRFAVGESSYGAILVGSTEQGVCAVTLGDDPDRLVRELQDRFPNATLIGDDPAFAAIVAKVVGFVEAPETGLDLPLDVRGTAFQHRVWQALRAIPAGTTVSYAELAERIGAPRAVRAVAGACANNAIAVAIPCHRVVRTDGALSGYRWGVERKRELLRRERKTS